MSIKKMKFVRISGPSSKLDKVISVCGSVGSFQPENAGEFISETMGYEPMNEESPYSPIMQNIKELATNYNYSLETPEKKNKVNIDNTTSEFIYSITGKLNTLAKNRKELEEQKVTCKEAIEKYSHFIGLGLDFKEIFECKFIRFRFGKLPKEGYLKFNKGYYDNPYILFIPCSTDDTGYWGAYFAPSNKVSEVDRIFAALQFERLTIPKAVGTAEEIVQHYEENIKIVEDEIAKLDAEVREIWQDSGDKIRAIYAKLYEMNTIFETRKYAVFNKNSCFFVGWIPESDEALLKEKLDNFTDFTVDFEKPKKSGRIQPPTKLKNLKIFRPYEYYVKMYGIPSYREMDITPFVAVTYTLLFGIMFGDLGQGLVVAVLGFYLYKKSGWELGKILVPCGLCSAVFGLIFGSVFGFEEALDPLYEKLGMSGKPLSVMDSINTVLLIAIGIGIALVFLAMVMNVIISIKKKKIGTALFSENGVAGICVYAGGVSLVYSFMGGKEIIPTLVAVIMMVVGLLILFNKEIIAESIDDHKFHKPESISDYIMQNIFECIEYILSYFSNTVSFLRVGAFVIVHASMMMVVFTLAGDTATIGGKIVVILGNIVVIALEGLLTGIQGLRLEFYEMFSRFFEGDGKPFNPLSLAMKRYVKKDKENK